MTIKSELVEITPAFASFLLTKNVGNRPIKRAHLARLKQDLLSGQWKFNGDTIRVSTDGRLLDGQHRLEAARQTGVAITAILVTGLEPDAFDTIDVGATRSAGDTLAVLGEKNHRNLAAALVFVEDLLTGDPNQNYQQKTACNTHVLEALKKHPALRESHSPAMALGKLVPCSAGMAIHYLASKTDPWKADVFFRGLATGENLEKGSPVHVLRERLILNSRRLGRIDRRHTAALVIKAWNYFIIGRVVRSITFRDDTTPPESFPRMLGVEYPQDS